MVLAVVSCIRTVQNRYQMPQAVPLESPSHEGGGEGEGGEGRAGTWSTASKPASDASHRPSTVEAQQRLQRLMPRSHLSAKPATLGCSCCPCTLLASPTILRVL